MQFSLSALLVFNLGWILDLQAESITMVMLIYLAKSLQLFFAYQ